MTNTTPSYKNRLNWGTMIKSLSFEDAFNLMHQIITLCIKNDTCPNPAYKIPFACAFSALLCKINQEKNTSHSWNLKQFHFSLAFLRYCTTLCIESYLATEEQTFGTNIMLEVAGWHGWYSWVHDIYDHMVSYNIADAATYGTAIKLFGKEKAFADAESAFSRFLSLDNLTQAQLTYGYGSMIFACRLNNKLSRAWEVFDLVTEKNIANVHIITAMISVVGRSGRIREACEFYARILNAPSVPDKTARQAKTFFDRHVIHPDKSAILEKILARIPSAASPIISPVQVANVSGERFPLLSDKDPVYQPQRDVIKKDYGVIGGHLRTVKAGSRYAFHKAASPDIKRPTAAKTYAACLK